MREIGASGSIYGVSTELHMLPGRKLGVVVITALDGANGIAARVATTALRALVAAQQHAPMPAWAETTPVPPRDAARLEGRYANGDSAIELRDITAPSDSDSTQVRLAERSEAGGTRATLRMRGDTLMRDDRFGFGTRLVVRGDALMAGTRALARLRDTRPDNAPPRLARLVGEYGWDHDILYIVERRGRIEALADWFYRAPLERVSDSTYRFPARSRFDSEPVTFASDAAGAVSGVRVGWRWFPRRAIGPASGNQLRVTPVRPIADLEREARAAQPPNEAPHPRRTDLVELVKLDSTIHLEIRYATTNNFLGTKFYPQARAFLQRPAAEALVRAHRYLKTMGYGILVHDSYRPWYVTKMFWDAVPEDKKIFVADPAQGSRHNRGAAADITLYDLATGKPVEMVSTYDETSDRAWANYPGGTSLQRWLRALLRHAMEAEGFTVYHAEWWHFDYRGFNEYPIGNIPYDQISGDTTARPAP
jgi:D-alanyl-D-alanine dipeptidase